MSGEAGPFSWLPGCTGVRSAVGGALQCGRGAVQGELGCAVPSGCIAGCIAVRDAVREGLAPRARLH